MKGLDRGPDLNVGTWISARAALHPDRPALISAASRDHVSFGELNQLANRAAARLQALGVTAGGRVALALESEPLYLGLYFAAAKLGAILVPLNTRLTSHELTFQLRDCDPLLVVAASALDVPKPPNGRLESRDDFVAAMPPDAEEPALGPGGEAPQVLMYTSGTTGQPKGALLPHRKTLYNTLNAEIYFRLTSDDIVVVAVPLFHSYGLKILSVPALFCGATSVLVDRFDPIAIQETIGRERATILGGVPVMYQRMVRAGLDSSRLSSLRFAFSAGAPIDIETIRAFHGAGVALSQGYGQTETSILCCLDDADALRRAGSVGRPVRHAELRIASPEGRTLPPGEAGEIQVRGPVRMLGYWRRPEETENSRVGGWHRTGDLGVMDEEGFVRLVGRLKELYISGGENVYPPEVERALEQHPNVAEAAVVGIPDPEWGETGRAYVVPVSPPLDAEELLIWARERLARYKLPSEVVCVDALPRTASGKVQKSLLVAPDPRR